MRIPYNEDDVTEVYSGACRETNEEELAGHPQSAATKKKISKAMTGKKNPAWKDGRRAYRRISKAKSGEGVHHINNDSKDNRASNLETYKLKGKERSRHEIAHRRQDNFHKSGGRKDKPRGYVAKNKAHGRL